MGMDWVGSLCGATIRASLCDANNINDGFMYVCMEVVFAHPVFKRPNRLKNSPFAGFWISVFDVRTF